MNLVSIRAAVKSKLLTISGISIVHDYLRWSNHWNTFLSLFKTDADIINGWMITRDKTPSRISSRTTAEREHNIRLIGVYGLDDSEATEITFQAQVEAITAAFDADCDLGGTTFKCKPCQVEVFEPRMFGSVLCHYTELLLIVHETQTYTV